MFHQGFVKVACSSPKVTIGNSMANVLEIMNVLKEVEAKEVSYVLFPEMAITGYSVGDLVFQDYLYRDNLNALEYLLKNNPFRGVLILGTYLNINGILYNVGLVIQGKKILGVVPKTFIPRTYEFSEDRCFASGNDANFKSVTLFGRKIPFGKMLFTSNESNIKFAVEVCEDVWAPYSPHEEYYASGASIVFNLSSSPEYVGKNDYRKLLCSNLSYKGNGAYLYASTGASESTSEVIFSSALLIYENGDLIAENKELSLETKTVYADLDIKKLDHIRLNKGWKRYIVKEIKKLKEVKYTLFDSPSYDFFNPLNKFPFIPNLSDHESFEMRTIDLQAKSIIKRLEYLKSSKVVLEANDTLDSMLAVLSLYYAFKSNNLDIDDIAVYYTKDFNLLDFYKSVVSKLGLKLIKLENNNASCDKSCNRYALKDISVESNALFVGSIDMTSVAIGKGPNNVVPDYEINIGLSITVVKELIKYYMHIYPFIRTELEAFLESVNEEKEIDMINDFLMYHFLVNGADENKLAFLVAKTFSKSDTEAKGLVNFFLKAFYESQTKRNTLPEGVKILGLSLSPRGEMRLIGDINMNN